MATFYLPSSNTGYSTNRDYVEYRIRIVENSFNSSERTENITVQAFFYRTNSDYTTDYAHKLTYTINGTVYSYTNKYESYPIDENGIYMNECTVDVPVNDDGSVNIEVYCQYTSTNTTSGLSTSNNGGSISLTNQIAKTFTVTYNANGGSGAPSSQTENQGTVLTISNVIPTRTGYTFSKWNTKSDGSGTSYNAGASYTADSDVTLYAIWTVRPHQNVYIYDDGTIYARGYFINGSTYIDNTGAIYAPSFTIGNSFYISSNGIFAKAFKEGTP